MSRRIDRPRIGPTTPIVKWAGGKWQLLPDITALVPDRYTTYYEPFVGGGAVLFRLQPRRAVVNDQSDDLMNVYRVVKDHLDALLEDLRKHKNTKEYYYDVRALDRDASAFAALSDVEKASRTLYLNKTCYNGLFRVNKKGQFNTPFGRYKNPNIVNEEGLRAVSAYFNASDIELCSKDFAEALSGVDKDSFVYLDPPYDPVSSSASFTAYQKGGFDRDEQIRLKHVCDTLDQQGVRFLLSNSSTDFIMDLYQEYHVQIVQANRSVNSKGDKRGAVDEVLVRNYAVSEA